eukprot:CAMPEP_0196171482 /NCGR_PEP_ID=MMETSP0911-20130528/5480_1 /TAXON_ID=49265 /ORGANISM="Thalassiosira rotula, Strain GSO102" /LENGTH=101 /DNA_ID=CAMNT_0041438305 /DNA_START=51 /DNA_END=353 /DNA_ORIENTATION=-
MSLGTIARKVAALNENSMSPMAIPKSIRCCVVVKRCGDLTIIQMRVEDEIVETIADNDHMMPSALSWPSLYSAPSARRSSMGIISADILERIMILLRADVT